MIAISSEDELVKIGKTEYTIIARIKSKLDKCNRIFKETPVSHREYDALLESYAEEIYDMCRKFYDAERRVSG